MQALQTTACCLEAELGAPPVSPLSVVSNLVVCPEANPLRDGSVLLGLLGQFPLDEESLLGRLQSRSTTISHTLHNDLSRLQLHTARDGRQENHKGHKAH